MWLLVKCIFSQFFYNLPIINEFGHYYDFVNFVLPRNKIIIA